MAHIDNKYYICIMPIIIPNGQVVREGKRDLIHLGYEDRGSSNKERRPIHINCSPQRNDKVGDPRVNLDIFITALESDWEGSGSTDKRQTGNPQTIQVKDHLQFKMNLFERPIVNWFSDPCC